MQAGCCSAVIEKLADYFIAIGYWNLEQEMQQMKKVDVMHDGCFVIAQDFSVLIAIAPNWYQMEFQEADYALKDVNNKNY